MMLFAANSMDQANAGSSDAQSLVRILTPLLKFRACRDNIPVATGSMEVRGGNGYIEEWVHARLVRDAHIGVLWEGTSNINALDIIQRAVGKSGAHRILGAALKRRLDEAAGAAEGFSGSPGARIGKSARIRGTSGGRTGRRGNRAACRQRALSHHQRHIAGLGRQPARRRCAPGAAGAFRAGTPADGAGSAGSRKRRLGTRFYRYCARAKSRPHRRELPPSSILNNNNAKTRPDRRFDWPRNKER